MIKRSTFGYILAITYLFLVLLSIIYALYRINFRPENSEFSGLLSLLLTLPWSHMLFTYLDPWLDNSIPETFFIITLSALINALLLYCLGALAAYLFSSADRRF
jgi:ABC-type glycerol-3-phosphate transport system permease component